MPSSPPAILAAVAQRWVIDTCNWLCFMKMASYEATGICAYHTHLRTYLISGQSIGLQFGTLEAL